MGKAGGVGLSGFRDTVFASSPNTGLNTDNSKIGYWPHRDTTFVLLSRLRANITLYDLPTPRESG